MQLPSESSYTLLKCPLCSRNITYEEVSIESSKCIIGQNIPSGYCFKCFSCRKGYGPNYKWDASMFPAYPDHSKCMCKNLYGCIPHDSEDDD